MPEKIKYGVIGVGWSATLAHISALIAHPRADLGVIQKRNPEVARKVADDLGIPHACISSDELGNTY
jgi:predicted dehydrogenase